MLLKRRMPALPEIKIEQPLDRPRTTAPRWGWGFELSWGQMFVERAFHTEEWVGFVLEPVGTVRHD
jgi:hypothetical protein